MGRTITARPPRAVGEYDRQAFPTVSCADDGSQPAAAVDDRPMLAGRLLKGAVMGATGSLFEELHGPMESSLWGAKTSAEYGIVDPIWRFSAVARFSVVNSVSRASATKGG